MLGRELKRVPLDFEYPFKNEWYGYLLGLCENCQAEIDDGCARCLAFAKAKEVPMTDHGCPDYETYFTEVRGLLKKLCEPPVGEGYQLWETTSLGSPISPVFETLDELCEWCTVNATLFGKRKATKLRWKELLSCC